MVAASNGHLIVVKALFKGNANMDVENENGMTKFVSFDSTANPKLN